MQYLAMLLGLRTLHIFTLTPGFKSASLHIQIKTTQHFAMVHIFAFTPGSKSASLYMQIKPSQHFAIEETY